MNFEKIFHGLTPLRLLIVAATIVLVLAGTQVVYMQFARQGHAQNFSMVNRAVTGASVNNADLASSYYETHRPRIQLAFFLNIASSRYQDNLKVFARNLQNGDYLIMRGDPSSPLAVIQAAKQSKHMFAPGVHVMTCLFYYAIGDIVRSVPKLPPGIDFVVYDYEKGSNYSPDFTTNESVSLGYFDQAEAAVLQYGKNTGSNAQLMVTPPVGELLHAGWNWGLAADHMDAIDMQLQAFVKDHALMKNLVSSTASHISEPKKHLVFVQLSLSRWPVRENIDAINATRDSRIGAFLIWYQATQTADLEAFFDALKR
ncbi:MAG: hypothetical protein ACM3UQ_00095 [Clostridiales bacterium]